MTDLFCPKCGKSAVALYDAVCRECFIGNEKLIECPEVIYLKICPTCGSVFKKGRWQSRKDESETIEECVKDSLKVNDQVSCLELALIPEAIDYSMYIVHVEARAKIKGVPMDKALETEVRISRETCDTCSRISGGYFEGIVQIRADKRIPTEDELKKCQKIAEEISTRSQEKGDRLAFITKIVKLYEGNDIYVGSQKLGKQICRAIIDAFGGKFSESPKLVGQKNGQDLYRITFVMRLPEFVRGDIILADGTVIQVQSSGKHVNGIDLETGRRFIENFNDLMDITRLGRKEDAVAAVFVAEEGKTIQVMDPETFETVTIKRPDFMSSEPGNEIKIIKTMKGIFVLP
jgi:nonsense-mediated mRNA decay protein 3